MNDLLIGLAGFAAFAGLHMLLLRRSEVLDSVVNIFLLGLSMHVLVTACVALLLPEPQNYWPGAGVYWFLLMFWVYAYGTAAKSLTVRMLVRVAKEAPVAEAALAEAGGQDDFGARLQVLREMGYAEESGGSWRLTLGGQAVAKRLRAMQRTLRVSGSSLYDWS
ncbi:hypothetical protein [Humidesulfovibrio sp.]